MLVNKSPISSSPGSVGGVAPSNSGLPKPETNPSATGFGELLDTKIAPPKMDVPGAKFEGLKFSQHALERMANRGIAFKPEEMMKLNDAVERAAKKGSRESLILMGETALIVSVKNKTVVTAMDREAMKENVFTNIDSTVII